MRAFLFPRKIGVIREETIFNCIRLLFPEYIMSETGRLSEHKTRVDGQYSDEWNSISIDLYVAFVCKDCVVSDSTHSAETQ